MSNEPEPEIPTPELEWTTTPRPESEFLTAGPVRYRPEVTGEPEVTSEPEATSSVEPEATIPGDQPYVEPVPDWERAKDEFGCAWQLHIYIVGTASAVLALLALISIIIIARIPKLKSKGYFIALNVLVVCFGTVRATYMFVDGYNSNHTLSPIVAYIAINLGYPSLTTMFYILFSALFRLTKFKRMNSRIFSVKYLVAISLSFFLLQFTADIVVGFFLEAWLLAFLCEIFFIIWGLVFSILFSIVFFRLVHATIVKRKLMKTMTGSPRGSRPSLAVPSLSLASTPGSSPKGSSASINKVGKGRSPKVDPTVQISAVAVFFFITIALVHMYGMMSANSLMTSETPDPWSWWTYHFILRTLELCMAFSVLFVATGPVRQRSSLIKKAKTPDWLPSAPRSKQTSQGEIIAPVSVNVYDSDGKFVRDRGNSNVDECDNLNSSKERLNMSEEQALGNGLHRNELNAREVLVTSEDTRL